MNIYKHVQQNVGETINFFTVHCLKIISLTALCLPAPLASRCYSHGKVETDEEFDARWVTYFSKPDLDAWELRKGEFDT